MRSHMGSIAYLPVGYETACAELRRAGVGPEIQRAVIELARTWGARIGPPGRPVSPESNASVSPGGADQPVDAPIWQRMLEEYRLDNVVPLHTRRRGISR